MGETSQSHRSFCPTVRKMVKMLFVRTIGNRNGAMLMESAASQTHHSSIRALFMWLNMDSSHLLFHIKRFAIYTNTLRRVMQLQASWVKKERCRLSFDEFKQCTKREKHTYLTAIMKLTMVTRCRSASCLQVFVFVFCIFFNVRFPCGNRMPMMMNWIELNPKSVFHSSFEWIH